LILARTASTFSGVVWFVDVPDDLLGQLPVLLLEKGQAGLPIEMVPEGWGPGDRVLERHGLGALREMRPEAVVQVFLEAGEDIVVAGSAGELRLGRFEVQPFEDVVLVLDPGLLGSHGLAVLGLALAGLVLDLDHRVLRQLFIDDLDELEVGQGEKLDGLLEGRG
jgi:hypothetical protein